MYFAVGTYKDVLSNNRYVPTYRQIGDWFPFKDNFLQCDMCAMKQKEQCFHSPVFATHTKSILEDQQLHLSESHENARRSPLRDSSTL